MRKRQIQNKIYNKTADFMSNTSAQIQELTQKYAETCKGLCEPP